MIKCWTKALLLAGIALGVVSIGPAQATDAADSCLHPTRPTTIFPRAIAAKDGFVYVTGSADCTFDRNVAGGMDGFLRKYTADGVLVWGRQFGTLLYNEHATAIAIDARGAVLVAGDESGPHYTTRGFIAKYGPDGDVRWRRVFATPFNTTTIDAMAVDKNGNVFVLDATHFDLTTNTNLRKYSTIGDLRWVQQFPGGQRNPSPYVGMTVDSQGNSFLVGGSAYIGPGGDAFLTKFAPGGSGVWGRTISTQSNDFLTSVTVDSTGAIIASGTTQGAFPGFANDGHSDLFVTKYSAAGVALKTRQIHLAKYNQAPKGIAADPGNNVYVASAAATWPSVDFSSSRAMVSKFAANGALMWRRALAAPLVISGVAAPTSDGVYVTGPSGIAQDGSTGGGVLERLDANGNVVWRELLAPRF